MTTFSTSDDEPDPIPQNAVIDCGWGKIIFANTYDSSAKLVEDICDEEPGRVNTAVLVDDPHLVLPIAPHRVFLGPYHTYRHKLSGIDTKEAESESLAIRTFNPKTDLETVRRIYEARQMNPYGEALADGLLTPAVDWIVVEKKKTGKVVACCAYVDHSSVDGGGSLWGVVVNPSANIPGIGKMLVEHVIKKAKTQKKTYLDLLVTTKNKAAISLYEKLGFERLQTFVVEHKNEINEPYFIGPPPEKKLDIHSRVIIDGARKRGISINVLDKTGFFELGFGGRTLACYESLTEFTNAISLKYCDNRKLNRKILKSANLQVPVGEEVTTLQEAKNFMAAHTNVEIKPLKGTKVYGTTTNITDNKKLQYALRKAKKHANRVLIEKTPIGKRYRFLVINFIARSVLHVEEPHIFGTGKHSVGKLIEKLNRRMGAMYEGMHIPMDKETYACLESQNVKMEDILPKNKKISLREQSNIKTGEFLENVTEAVPKELLLIAENAARILGVPVLGIDMIVSDLKKPKDYVIVDCHERPSLAPPHPTQVVDEFIDFLFPQLTPLK